MSINSSDPTAHTVFLSPDRWFIRQITPY